MKNIYFSLILFLVCVCGCKTIKPVAGTRPEVAKTTVPVTDAASSAINFSDPATWLLGYFNRGQLMHEPYSTWFIKGYDDYQLKTDVVNKLFDIGKDGITIKIVMGTWCSDSRREVPRFMRVLDAWQFPGADITFIGVDNARHSPVSEYNKLDIQRVPTFIIYKNNNESGRIIENPTTSLEQDMVNILTRNEK
jgi:thiol-disulfide isomerase/thioredoxin